jgi:hypothetical protein
MWQKKKNQMKRMYQVQEGVFCSYLPCNLVVMNFCTQMHLFQNIFIYNIKSHRTVNLWLKKQKICPAKKINNLIKNNYSNEILRRYSLLGSSIILTWCLIKILSAKIQQETLLKLRIENLIHCIHLSSKT